MEYGAPIIPFALGVVFVNISVLCADARMIVLSVVMARENADKLSWLLIQKFDAVSC